MAWFAAWSAVSATAGREVPGGLIDSSCKVTSPLVQALTLAVSIGRTHRHAGCNTHRPEIVAAGGTPLH
jgi:hypothetical protein